MRTRAIVVVAILIGLGPAWAQSSAAAAGEVRLQPMGQWGGMTRAIAKDSDTVYFGVGSRVHAASVHVPGSPKDLGRSAVLSDIVVDIAIGRSVLYAASRDGSIAILDTRASSFLSVLGVFQVDSSPVSDLLLIPPYLYVAGHSRVRVLDVTVPARPVERGKAADVPYVQALVRNGPTILAYTVDSVGSWLLALDVSDPGNPTLIGRCRLGDSKNAYPDIDLAVKGGRAYVPFSGLSVAIVDVADPRAPRLLAAVPMESDVVSVEMRGDRMVVCEVNRGLAVYDVGIPAKAERLGSVMVPTYTYRAISDGDFIFTAGGPSGLQVVDARNPGAMSVVSAVDADASAYARGVQVGADRRLYAGTDVSGMAILDLGDPTAPRKLGAIDHTGCSVGTDVLPRGNLAYFSNGTGGVAVMDITNPRTPTVIGLVTTPELAIGMDISGTTVVAACNDAGVAVIDASNPRVPVIRSMALTSGPAHAVVTDGRFIYVPVYQGGLEIQDIRDPDHPVRVAYLQPAPGHPVRAVVLRGTYAYAIDDKSLYVLAIRTPASPSIVLSVPVNNSSGLTMAGDRLYAFGNGRVTAFDLSVPDKPRRTATYRVGGDVRALAVLDDLLITAESEAGVVLYRLPPPGS